MIKHLLISGILILVYHFVHRKRDQLQFNRFFIIIALLFSAIVPLIEINAFPIYKTISIQAISPKLSSGITQVASPTWSIEMVFWSISALFLLFSVFRIAFTYRSMARKHHLSQSRQYNGSPMSFFHFIAIPNSNDSIVVAHEQYHVLAGHSIDRILITFYQAILWANPLLFLYKRYLIENHELAADQYSMKVNSIDQISYSEHLVEITKQNIALPNSLPIPNHYYSLILNRIQMLHSKKSSSTILKFLSVAAFIGLFCSFTLKSYTVTSLDNTIENETIDTLPNLKNMITTDTVTVFDPKTMTESVKIVKNYPPGLNSYINSINYSGNMTSLKDTIYTLDYDTYEEKVSIVKWEYPVEITELLQQSDYNDWELIIDMAKKAMKK